MNNKKIYRYIHYFLAIGMSLMPVLFRWEITAIVLALSYIQLLILKRCFLTILEYGSNDGPHFMEDVYAKYGIRFTNIQRKLAVLLQYLLLILGSYIWEHILNLSPLLA